MDESPSGLWKDRLTSGSRDEAKDMLGGLDAAAAAAERWPRLSAGGAGNKLALKGSVAGACS